MPAPRKTTTEHASGARTLHDLRPIQHEQRDPGLTLHEARTPGGQPGRPTPPPRRRVRGCWIGVAAIAVLAVIAAVVITVLALRPGGAFEALVGTGQTSTPEPAPTSTPVPELSGGKRATALAAAEDHLEMGRAALEVSDYANAVSALWACVGEATDVLDADAEDAEACYYRGMCHALLEYAAIANLDLTCATKGRLGIDQREEADAMLERLRADSEFLSCLKVGPIRFAEAWANPADASSAVNPGDTFSNVMKVTARWEIDRACGERIVAMWLFDDGEEPAGDDEDEDAPDIYAFYHAVSTADDPLFGLSEWYGSPPGAVVAPGTYTLRLFVGGQLLEEASFTVTE